MIIRNNVPIYDICWLNHAKGGIIGAYYEPENKEELVKLCRSLYNERKNFDVIGHTSNIYFLPSYSVDIMISTRKVKNLEVQEDFIIADCGVPVSSLARQMVNDGIMGFEGLIDLPGTVAASVYGNASCYGCSINALLESFELLRYDGKIAVLKIEDLKLSHRTSSLKCGELQGVIISVKLRKKQGDVNLLKQQAEKIHQTRKLSQPGPKDNLGSIYYSTGSWKVYSYIPRFIVRCYSLFLKILGNTTEKRMQKNKKLFFSILGITELLPYVHDWNRYIWKDEKSHELFWEYHKIHQKLFKNSKFEIVIKGLT